MSDHEVKTQKQSHARSSASASETNIRYLYTDLFKRYLVNQGLKQSVHAKPVASAAQGQVVKTSRRKEGAYGAQATGVAELRADLMELKRLQARFRVLLEELETLQK